MARLRPCLLTPGDKLVLLQVEEIVKHRSLLWEGHHEWQLHDLITGKLAERINLTGEIDNNM